MIKKLVYSSLSDGHEYFITLGSLEPDESLGKVYKISGQPNFVCKVIPNRRSYVEYASTWRQLDALYYLGKLEGYSRDQDNTYIFMKKVEGIGKIIDKGVPVDEDLNKGLGKRYCHYFDNGGYFHWQSRTGNKRITIITSTQGKTGDLISWSAALRFNDCLKPFYLPLIFWTALVFIVLGAYPTVYFYGLREILTYIHALRLHLYITWPFESTLDKTDITIQRNNMDEFPSYYAHLGLFLCSLVVTVILGFYITSPLLLEVFELCVIASSLSSVSGILPLLSIFSVVRTTILLIQAYSFAVVNLGMCYETIGLIMPEKAWRLYTDFEFHYATKPVCFMKRCFYNKAEAGPFYIEETDMIYGTQ